MCRIRAVMMKRETWSCYRYVLPFSSLSIPLTMNSCRRRVVICKALKARAAGPDKGFGGPKGSARGSRILQACQLDYCSTVRPTVDQSTKPGTDRLSDSPTVDHRVDNPGADGPTVRFPTTSSFFFSSRHPPISLFVCAMTTFSLPTMSWPG